MQTALSSFVCLVSMKPIRLWLAKIATFSSSILERFENALVTVNYSHYPHSQDYLAPGNKHATVKIAAELCIHAFYLAMNVVCGVPCSIPGAK